MKINFQNKAVWKTVSTIVLVGVFGVFNQCVVQQYDKVSTSGGSDETQEVVDDYHQDPIPDAGAVQFEETGATEVAKTITSVGVKNFEEIYWTMSVLTGIDPANESRIRNLYNDLYSQLPTDDSIKSYMTTNQVAVVKLGAEYCDRLFGSSQYYNNFFNNFNVGAAPNQALNANGKELMTREFIEKFWGKDTQTDNLVQTTQEEMGMLIDELLVGMNMDSSTSTRQVAKGVCTAIISSAPVVLL